MKKFLVLATQAKVPLLTYEGENETKPGDIVLVPFRSGLLTAIVWAEHKDFMPQKYAIKEISHNFEDIKIKPEILKFIESFAKYFLIDHAAILKMIIPLQLKMDLKKRIISQLPDIKLPKLNKEQESAYHDINLSAKVSLLEGVTGSGKTEVYFHMIADYLAKNKQVLLMLPEIGLTKQILERFQATFGFAPSTFHSGVTPATKRDIFYGILDGSVKVVIGTRSSLFLPFKNLGLIIVDEEQDGSYKQEEGSLYNARDAAIMRASIEGVRILLVSATPSLETYYNCQIEKFHHSILTSRFGEAKIPNINIVNMRKEPKGKFISQKLILAMKEALDNNKQIILFLNRRGYSPLMLCTCCGYRFNCKDCSSWLVYHKKDKALICHHCGYEEFYNDECPDCKTDSLMSCGPGVERIEEEVQLLFPECRVEQFTKEQNISAENTFGIIERIEKGEVDIIIGTQVITKGFHFPNVTVVGIIDADIGSANIDLKANERCFQLLSQVSGRAGRGEFEGSAFVQTYYPENSLFELLKTNDQKSFYEQELEDRKAQFLPPHSRIIAVIITGDDEIESHNFAKKFRNVAIKNERVKILGPAPASMSKLRGKYRYRLLFIADKKFNLQGYTELITKHVDSVSHNRIRIEVDPYSFY